MAPQAPASERALELRPAPSYIDHRISIFEELWEEQRKKYAEQTSQKINVTLPDGKVEVGDSFVTTPFQIARSISKSLSDRVIVARVNDELWDLNRPLEVDCRLAFLDFSDEDGRAVYWHSSAHILGEAAERHFGCHLVIGPPTSNGFYYEMELPNKEAVKPADVEPLNNLARSIMKEKQPFQRLVLTKGELLKMFEANRFKQHIIRDKIPEGSSTTVYRCGPLIDLCRGPHVPDTSKIKAFQVLKHSASYFLGDPTKDPLQRVYGISFPDKKLLTQHLKDLEEAAKRDHRKIGKDQELFFFHDLSPGSAFFLPHGMVIYNNLQGFIRSEYWTRGYQEVGSPNIFNSALWKKSGHWQHYHEDMFVLEAEKETWGLKPMNCPGHCLVFGSRVRNYKELPIRMAEFGISNEISGVFDFFRIVYGALGFTFKLRLSTRPEGFLGKVETWDKAEATLKAALDKFCGTTSSWELNPGDGAFYGPKIDVAITDALKREHQTATIQLDFQLPERFDLSYQIADQQEATAQSENADAKAGLGQGLARPVMIHRAICGSFERFIAILTEHFAGKWPFWLSPRQILLIPVMTSATDYVKEVHSQLRAQEFHVDMDLSGNTMNKKIRSGQLLQYNFIFVLGAQEMEKRAVSVRSRDTAQTNEPMQVLELGEAVDKLKALRQSKSLENKII